MIKASYVFWITLFSIMVTFIEPVRAGFEWVPSQKQDAPKAQSEEPSGQIPQNIPDSQIQDPILMVPMPLSKDAVIDEQQTPPPIKKIQPEPTVATAPAPPIIHPPLHVLTPPEPEEPVIKTIDVRSKKEAEGRAMPPPQPAKIQTIMPEDAPQTAMDEIPSSTRLALNPFPLGEKQSVSYAPTPVEDTPDTEITSVEPVIGFGNEVALAIALGQVIPPNFALSFGENVNPGAKVSWNGGKGWEDVVADMIAPLGLSAVIRSNTIHIKRSTPVTGEKQTSLQIPESINIEEISFTSPEKIERDSIIDPGQTPIEQPPETIEHIKKITENSSNKTADEMNAKVLAANKN